MPAPRVMGIYPPDSVQEVAQSLPLDPLTSPAADLLASDVEYRLHQIVQEAKKFMVHGKRGTLMPEDVEYALEALNVEPILIPPRPLPLPPFQALPLQTPSGTSQIYHTPDAEIDFHAYLKEPLPAGLASSAGVKWRAHWLAVEGVQPSVPENPATSRAGPSRSTLPRPLAKSHLPQELQLYYTRLTSALCPQSTSTPDDTERHRLAALASLRSDAAVAGLLVYLTKWFAESIQRCLIGSTTVLSWLVDGVEALLGNENVFVEPHLHQLLPPLMSILLTVPLGPHPPSSSGGSKEPTPFELRVRASEVLGKIASEYGSRYSGLLPRLVSTLTNALNSSPFPSPLGASNPPAGRYEGAVLGLAALGASAVREGMWGGNGDGLVRIDDLCGRLYPGGEGGGKRRGGLMRASIKALSTLIPPKPDEVPAPPSFDEVTDLLGPHFARALEKRPWTAGELVRMRREAMQGGGGGMQVD